MQSNFICSSPCAPCVPALRALAWRLAAIPHRFRAQTGAVCDSTAAARCTDWAAQDRKWSSVPSLLPPFDLYASDRSWSIYRTYILCIFILHLPSYSVNPCISILHDVRIFLSIQEISLRDISCITIKAPCETPAMHGRHVCKGITGSVLYTFTLWLSGTHS